MSNSFFRFKQFTVHQQNCAMKITTDACLFGAWTAMQLKQLPEKTKTILDIGTGTGLLSLMLIQKNQTHSINAIEIDKNAAMQAATNFAATPWKEKLNVINENVINFSFPKLFDFIICNPPFYENDLKSNNIKKNIAHHDEGLNLKNLFQIIKTNLSNDGTFCMLLPYKRDIEIHPIFHQYHFKIITKTYVRQSTKHDFFRILIHGKIENDADNR